MRSAPREANKELATHIEEVTVSAVMDTLHNEHIVRVTYKPSVKKKVTKQFLH